MSKSLLVNVLDMEDNYKLGLGQPSFTASHTVPDIADVYRRRCSSNIIYPHSLPCLTYHVTAPSRPCHRQAVMSSQRSNLCSGN